MAPIFWALVKFTNKNAEGTRTLFYSAKAKLWSQRYRDGPSQRTKWLSTKLNGAASIKFVPSFLAHKSLQSFPKVLAFLFPS